MEETDAAATVKFAILDAISDTWGKDPETIVEAVRKKLFESPTTRWATEEYFAEMTKAVAP